MSAHSSPGRRERSTGSPSQGETWRRRKLPAGPWALLLLLAAAPGCRTGPPAPSPLPRVPSLLYWFWPPDILEGRRIETDLRDIARRTSFSLVFVSPRGPFTGMDLTDTRRFTPYLRRAAATAGRLGIGLGLECRYTAFLREPVPEGERQGLVTLHEGAVGPGGAAALDVPPPPLLFPEIRVLSRRVLAAAVPGAAEPIDPSLVVLEGARAAARLDPRHAGRRLSLAVLHELDYPDLFSPYHPRLFRRTLAAYAPLGLSGAALDEFSALPLRDEGYETARLHSPALAARYRVLEGRDLAGDILRERHSPHGERVAIANATLELQRARLEELEGEFHAAVKEVLGPKAFVGVHPTVQNETARETLFTAFDWWGVKRDFGQTDEGTCFPVRLALGLKAGGPAWYNMFYTHRIEEFLDEIAECARFGGRVHFHAWHETIGYGLPLERPGVMEALAPALRKIALLDEVQDALPRPDLLVVFGWRAVTCRADHPRQFARLEEVWRVARALWNAGHVCALVPDTEIESGALRVRDGAVRYGPATFPAVLFLHPEYLRFESRWFLEAVERAGLPLAVHGSATADHRGRPAPLDLARFTLPQPTPAALDARGIRPTGFPGGSRLLDGSLLLVDRASLAGGPEVHARHRLDGRDVEARFRGVLLLRLDAHGAPDLLAAGKLRELRIDGRVAAAHDPPADVVLRR